MGEVLHNLVNMQVTPTVTIGSLLEKTPATLKMTFTKFFQGYLIKMGDDFINMRVGTSVTIGSLLESDHCESDGDLENDLDLVFQGHLIKMGYNFINM